MLITPKNLQHDVNVLSSSHRTFIQTLGSVLCLTFRRPRPLTSVQEVHRNYMAGSKWPAAMQQQAILTLWCIIHFLMILNKTTATAMLMLSLRTEQDFNSLSRATNIHLIYPPERLEVKGPGSGSPAMPGHEPTIIQSAAQHLNHQATSCPFLLDLLEHQPSKPSRT